MSRLCAIDLMPAVRVVRLQDHDECGMLGMMSIDAQLFCATLEPPDKGNAPNISCIPKGQYVCQRYFSQRFHRELFRVLNVPFRSAIAVHSGKQVEHTEGCLLLGSHHVKMTHDRQIANTGLTLTNFMSVMDGVDRFHLTIVESF